MLVCPQCQFENPNTNKFCQRCGTSLTHKACQECGTQVPINAETCHNCGTFTGTVWWAIISKYPEGLLCGTDTQNALLETVTHDTSPAEKTQDQECIAAEGEHPSFKTSPVTSPSIPVVPESQVDTTSPVSSPQNAIDDSSDKGSTQTDVGLGIEEAPVEENQQESSVPSPSQASILNPQQTYFPNPSVIFLDSQQRYRLLNPQDLQRIEINLETDQDASVQVLDCQPFQQSPLEALMEQQSSNPQFLPPSESQSPTLSPESWKALGIPVSAQAYLALYDSYDSTLPKVHDAWQHEGKAVVLLEDRSGWQMVSDLWETEELSTLQILYWLDEMAKLWEVLEPWHCRQSLLETTNLRVDEDQALALQRLYPEVGEQPLTLQDLGRMWQLLFSQSQRTLLNSLGTFFRQMCGGEIETISEVRSHLQAIASEQEVSVMGTTQDNPSRKEDQRMLVAPPNEISELSDTELEPTIILPMQLMSLDDAADTDIGQQRFQNEDFYCLQTQIKKLQNPAGRTLQARGLYILCDGMGGHAGGEEASAMAAETLRCYFQDHWQDHLPTEESIREAVLLANKAIYEVNEQKSSSSIDRMGTTLVMLLIHNTKAAIAHVGDSRLYRLTRKQGLEQLTVDHEVGQREINQGVDPEIAYRRPDAYQLTQALGPRNEQYVRPDVTFLDLNEDMLFLLCSDGLSDNDLIETYWQTHLAPLLSSRANLDHGIRELIELANENNGHDNITAVLVRAKVRPNPNFDQPQLF
ncbi:MAG TPA: serine/threonine phosphatase [Coleofasciculaceae cyanobacterium]